MKFSDLFKLQPKQYEAAQYINNKRYIYYGGARGGGKTYFTVAMAVYCALKFPGIRIVFIRKTKKELKEEIIDRLINQLPDGMGKYYKTDMVYKFSNGRNGRLLGGSRISFIGLDRGIDAIKEKGIERQMYVVDEANDIETEILERLPGSLRNTTIPNFKPCIIYTGNPGGISDHYFEKYFVKPTLFNDYSQWSERELQHKDDYVFIRALLEDNPAILEKDPDYVKFLEGLPEHLYRAWRLGEWGVFRGKFFDEWDERLHIISNITIPDHWGKWIGIDLGFQSHPSVALFFAQDPITGKIYVYDELAVTGSVMEFIELLKEKCKGQEFITRFADPAIFAEDNNVYDLSMYFIHAGLFIEKAYNKREMGWRIVKMWLNPFINNDGQRDAMLKVLPNCQGLIETLPKMKYKNDYTFDLNTRDLDDYVDALRYGLVHIVPGFIYISRNNYKYMKTKSTVHLTINEIQEIIDKGGVINFDDIELSRMINAPAVVERKPKAILSQAPYYNYAIDEDYESEYYQDVESYYTY
ncbi:MAG: phage terminase large subunit [Candidatus Dojkabacteria bacterium]|nr:MAG: phage terminase large subunit [Candidatus Dojkabacteria bacterium]